MVISGSVLRVTQGVAGVRAQAYTTLEREHFDDNLVP